MVRALEVLCPTVQTLPLTVVKTQQSDLCGGTFLSVAPEPATWVKEVEPNSLMDVAGAKVDDRIVSVAGIPIVGADEISTIIRSQPGTFEMVVVRGEARV